MTATFLNVTQPLVGDRAAATSRSVVTTIFYPARRRGRIPEAVVTAPADRGAGPYPLIVFSHGLGASPAAIRACWSGGLSPGYVVAAPAFPKTNTAATRGIDPGDFANQPPT